MGEAINNSSMTQAELEKFVNDCTLTSDSEAQKLFAIVGKTTAGTEIVTVENEIWTAFEASYTITGEQAAVKIILQQTYIGERITLTGAAGILMTLLEGAGVKINPLPVNYFVYEFTVNIVPEETPAA